MAIKTVDFLNINNYLNISYEPPIEGTSRFAGYENSSCCLRYNNDDGTYRYLISGAGNIPDTVADGYLVTGTSNKGVTAYLDNGHAYSKITASTYYLITPSEETDSTYVSPKIVSIGESYIVTREPAGYPYNVRYLIKCLDPLDNFYIESNGIPYNALGINNPVWDNNVLVGGYALVYFCLLRNIVTPNTTINIVLTKSQLLDMYNGYSNFQNQLSDLEYGGLLLNEHFGPLLAGIYQQRIRLSAYQMNDKPAFFGRVLVPFVSETEYHAAKASVYFWDSNTQRIINNWSS